MKKMSMRIVSMIMGAFMLTTSLEMKAEVDPNFHIYICFGQSNMEGNAQWESQDVGNVDERFQMLATCNFDNPKRTLGNWYKAICPIVNPQGKLGPSDYFGRTMVAHLPDNKIGVIAVAMGGSPIEMFDKDKYQQKLQDNPNEWWAQLAKWYYGGNPYGRIIEMAKKAQEVGVIKGILLHQGCSNCGDPNWPDMVKKIYNDMLSDLGLQAEDVPLLAGEVEYQNMGGGCSSHNVQVDRLPSVIPTAHVVSAKYLPGNGTDPWHFSAQGYRLFGQRYAQIMLSVVYGLEIDIDQPSVPLEPKEVDYRFSALKENFWRFLVHGTVFYAAVVFSYVSFNMYLRLLATNAVFMGPLIITIIIILIFVFMFFYIPVMTVTFDIPMRYIYKNSFLMCYGELKHNFIALLGLFFLTVVSTTFLICCYGSPVAVIIVSAVLFAFFVPAIASFIINSAVYARMYEMLTDRSGRTSEINAKIEEKEKERQKKGESREDYLKTVREFKLDESIPDDEYVYFNGRMVKKSVIKKLKAEAAESEEA